MHESCCALAVALLIIALYLYVQAKEGFDGGEAAAIPLAGDSYAAVYYPNDEGGAKYGAPPYNIGAYDRTYQYPAYPGMTALIPDGDRRCTANCGGTGGCAIWCRNLRTD
jgi:hypothetical protein